MSVEKELAEAHRYLENAREILREKAGKQDGFYSDKKYVKLAGHAAYSAVLVALDAFWGLKKKGRKDVFWYKENLAQVDKKALTRFNAAYDTLHLSLGYDGNLDAKVAKAGLESAEWLIDWVEQRLVPASVG